MALAEYSIVENVILGWERVRDVALQLDIGI